MYAVVDVETTGLGPRTNRIAEIAVALVDARGEIERTWCTLINPERDLGPQHIHGISASDVLFAPTFAQAAGQLSELLSARILVAHNVTFDLRFLAAEYARLGHTVAVSRWDALCTMDLAAEYLPGSGRALVDCCAAAGIPPAAWHSAEADANATAQLLSHYIRAASLNGGLSRGRSPASWPELSSSPFEPVQRGTTQHAAPHFLARISEHLPRHPETIGGDTYLSMLDRALLDRHVSVTESDALVEVAGELGLNRGTVETLHRSYLADLGRAALADGIVTDEERDDLAAVARLLGAAPDMVDEVLDSSSVAPVEQEKFDRFSLKAGDVVVFTGQMSRDRGEWEARALSGGLVPDTSVTKQTSILVAADTDSMSGKARRARELGVPVIDEATFERMLNELTIEAAPMIDDELTNAEPDESTPRAHDQAVTLEAVAASILSYPIAHNRVPVVSRVTISPPARPVLGATLRFEIRDADGPIGRPHEMLVDLDGSGPLTLTDVDLVAEPVAMLQVEEQRPAVIRLTLSSDGVGLANCDVPVLLLAAHQWRTQPVVLALEMLAAFVTPNHPAITQLVSEASDILAQQTGSPSVQGYQAGSERVDAIVRAIYEAMQARHIRYSEPPASWSDVGQKIRTPSEVLDGRVGTCLDTVVVMAAALEQAGIRPLLWIVEGHAFLGYWRDELGLDGTATTDVGDVVNLMDLGLIRLVETTMVTAGDTRTPFEQTHRPPRATYLSGDLANVIGVTDVRQARLAGIVPLPARVRDADGAVTVVEYRAAEHAIAPPASPGPADRTPSVVAEIPPRIQSWKNSLLDLSLRNRLINFTERSALQLAVPDGYLPALEDLLHDNVAPQLLPSDQFASIHRERGVTTARDLPQEQLAELFTSKRALHVDVSEAAYQTRMRNLAYKARTIVEETGANNLYLALGSLAWSLDGRDLRSPLVLVPVKLVTRSRQTAYRIELDESGSSTPNYCLLEKLRQLHGMDVPGLAEPAEDGAGVDLDAAFDALRIALADRRLPFRVEPTAHLAILQFSKFRLWKDLDEHWQELSRNPLVAHLVHTPTDPFDDPKRTDAATVDLDDVAAGCPVPGDASQLEAVSAAAAGSTFVLEGPPGTGKSQTITNLLARAVAEGKKVLFVAEKRAALDVVKDRLDRVGMEPFSLDLHDKGSRPAAVRSQIKRALDHTAPLDEQGLAARTEDLQSERRRLARYAQQLHEKNGAGLSLYTAHTGQLAMDAHVPALPVPNALLTSAATDSVEELRHILRTLPDVADAARPRRSHPWGFIDSDDAGSIDPTAAREAVTAFDAALQALPTTGPLADVLRAVTTVDNLVVLAGMTSTNPVPLDALDQASSPQWDAAANDIVQHVATFVAAAHPELESVTPAALDLPLGDIHARAQAAAASGFFGRKKRLVAVRDELQPAMRPRAVVKPKLVPTLTAALVQLQGTVRGLADNASSVPGVSVPSSWNPLTDAGRVLVERQVQWLRWAAAAVRAHASGADSFVTALRTFLATGSRVHQDDAAVIARLRDAAQRLVDVCQVDDVSLSAWSGTDGLIARWRLTTDGRDVTSPEMWGLRRWITLLVHLEPLRVTGMNDARLQLLSAAVDANDAVRAFDRGVAESSLAERSAATGLGEFNAVAHERSIERFTKAASAVREAMSTAIPAQVLAARPFDPSIARGQVGLLQRQLARQRGGMSVRALLENFGDLITQVMPCVLVSPDSLARFFPPRAGLFDLVVFDEASQIRVADAIGAMGRAESVVVVGDSKQMPPTSFAEPATPEDGDVDPTEGAVEDEESILSECVYARVERQWLSWHYRSQDESLIAFSNHQYYESKLSTFPAPSAPGSTDLGVSLVRVDGQFHRSGKGKLLRTNPAEAEAVVAEIRRRFDASPDVMPSLGIVTFNQQQRSYIEALIRDSDDDRLVEALDGTDEEGLFVKNLENVQGDERDVILFSTAFSVNDKGVLPLNFGPLNRAGGERRLNVAITRARRRVIVFSSFDPAQLRADETSSVGIKHLRAYLDIAEQGTHILPNNPSAATAVDRHAEDIAKQLRSRGLAVTTGIGLSDFKVDIGIAAAEDPDHALVAVLLDGPGWAARRTVGDRDGLPTEVLAQLLHWPAVERVWLPSWLADPVAVTDRLAQVVDDVQAGTRAADAEADTRLDGDDLIHPAAGAANVDLVVDVSAVDRPGGFDNSTTGPAVRDSDRVPALARPIASSSLIGYSEAPPATDVARLPGQTHYVPWSPEILGTIETLNDLGKSTASNRQVSAVLQRVIDVEGPIHTERLAKLVASAFGLSKVHASRREAILALLPQGSMPDAAEVEVAWPKSLDYRTWTGFRGGSENEERKFDHVSLREVINAMAALCSVSAGMLESELKREALAVFGGRRMTGGIEARLDKAIALGLSSGRLTHGPGSLIVVA